MPTIQITILSITPKNNPTKTPGKTTPVLDLAYKNLTFQGKVEGKVLFSFAGNKGGYDSLINAKPGETYDVTVVKNDAGFNDWTFAVKSDLAGSPIQTPAASTSPAKPGYAPVAKSSYPTDEERAKTQIYIVRQSNITAAINLLTVGAKSPPKVEDIIATAKVFEAHVFGNSNDSVKPAEKLPVEQVFDDLDDMPS